jgi:hypothetical protein
MSEPNQNWHSVCDKSDGMVLVRPLGKTSQYTYNLDPNEAAQLCDELTEAVEEAKRQADPFEKWWSGLVGEANCASLALGVWVSKDVAREIWDAATKAKR